jgi:hypothetical protein
MHRLGAKYALLAVDSRIAESSTYGKSLAPIKIMARASIHKYSPRRLPFKKLKVKIFPVFQLGPIAVFALIKRFLKE